MKRVFQVEERYAKDAVRLRVMTLPGREALFEDRIPLDTVIVCLDSEVPAGKAADLVTPAWSSDRVPSATRECRPVRRALARSGPPPSSCGSNFGHTIWSDRAMACSITDREPGPLRDMMSEPTLQVRRASKGGSCQRMSRVHGAAPPRVIFRTPT